MGKELKYMYMFTLISLTRGSMISTKNDRYHNIEVPLMFLKSFKNYDIYHKYFKGYVNSSEERKKEFLEFYEKNKHMKILHLESGKLSVVIKSGKTDNYLIHPLLLTHYDEYIAM